MNASLNKKLRSVKWGEFKLGELFDVLSYKKRFDANKVSLVKNGGHPYIVRQSTDNGKKGNIDESVLFLNHGNTISFGQDTATMFYQEVPYFTGDKIKILKPKYVEFGKKNAQFFLASMRKTFSSFAWGSSRFNVETLKEQLIMLPINNGKIDFDFMESFIAKLEAERVAELSAYLTVSGLDNYELSSEEENALKNYKSLKWDAYNLEKLFGKSTRGKRLKGDDRIAGTLPFVTAGEASEGISAYISNNVEVFEKNTTTIDMFGSAKYRNYQYGADDYVAVVHTESVPMKASIFLTSAIHKAAHTGKFDYGHNFYAKDADALDIMLPTKDGEPDFDSMATLISAVQKLVIKDIVIYADRKIEKIKEVTKSEG
jgi:Type I restriction modification DNA specificity domain.